MSDGKPAFLNDELSKRTSIFGLRLWVVLGICVGAAIVIFLFLISLWFTSRRNKKSSSLLLTHKNSAIPNVSREIQEIRVDPTRKPETNPKLLLPAPGSDPVPEADPSEDQRIHIEIGKGHRIAYPEKVGPVGSGSGHGSGEARPGAEAGAAMPGPEVSHLGWGHWEDCRGGRGQAEREFKVEVEAIGRVRHKNLVRLLGYCAEGAHRTVASRRLRPYSPLTWEIRMNIILGTAKGLTYLHECLEPKVVHRDIKSSNILLDKQWNAKVSDFGLAKLIGSERSYITTRVMGTFGYVAPEYASTGMLNERSDVYSFGILIMEIIREKSGVLDPKLHEKPSSRALKRTLLVALRCVDPNAQKRPKMGHVVHMLEADDFPFRDERRGGREHGRSHRDSMKDRVVEKRITEPGDSSGYESSVQTDRSLLRKQETDEERC
ncbi:putative serine/threonine-protein kinase [Sesamum angolense]|uniref:non-specific serine/threonine protein kinase n=1 Tax=Sesamum angolense TaxID=2727404 RepID=A0AAE1T6N3_9LAMI|nr:putative serine/threonine-protein kinase [Sesamum angolense]